MTPEADPSNFLGLTAAAWAGLAAIAAFATALITAIVAWVTHRASGARPRVTLQWIGVRPQGIDRLKVGKKMPPGYDWQENALDCIKVRVENRGRSPVTVGAPEFQLLKPWYDWRRYVQVMTLTPKQVPVDNGVTAPRARIEAYDDVCFVLPLEGLFVQPERSDERHRTWKRVCIRVPVAGQRVKVVRFPTFEANPSMEQRSGEPLTLGQIVAATVVQYALETTRDGPEENAINFTETATTVEGLRSQAHRNGGMLTSTNVFDTFKRDWTSRHNPAAFRLVARLRAHGFLDDRAEN